MIINVNVQQERIVNGRPSPNTNSFDSFWPLPRAPGGCAKRKSALACPTCVSKSFNKFSSICSSGLGNNRSGGHKGFLKIAGIIKHEKVYFEKGIKGQIAIASIHIWEIEKFIGAQRKHSYFQTRIWCSWPGLKMFSCQLDGLFHIIHLWSIYSLSPLMQDELWDFSGATYLSTVINLSLPHFFSDKSYFLLQKIIPKITSLPRKKYLSVKLLKNWVTLLWQSVYLMIHPNYSDKPDQTL